VKKKLETEELDEKRNKELGLKLQENDKN